MARARGLCAAEFPRNPTFVHVTNIVAGGKNSRSARRECPEFVARARGVCAAEFPGKPTFVHVTNIVAEGKNSRSARRECPEFVARAGGLCAAEFPGNPTFVHVVSRVKTAVLQGVSKHEFVARARGPCRAEFPRKPTFVDMTNIVSGGKKSTSARREYQEYKPNPGRHSRDRTCVFGQNHMEFAYYVDFVAYSKTP